MVPAITIWLHIFVCCPLDTGPQWLMLLPITERRGLMRWKVSSLHPVMKVRVASLAPLSPPETGASANDAPFSMHAFSISSMREGRVVVMSTAHFPSLRALTIPFSPR